MRFNLAWFAVAGLVVMPWFVFAEDDLAAFDHFRASDLATQRYDLEQRSNIAMQLATIDRMKWYSGMPSRFGRIEPSLDYLYAYGYPAARPSYRQPFDVFEPWPFVPGDIWGYPWHRPVRQPIGRRESQTGIYRWESHPVYAPRVPTREAPERVETGPREF